jgi:hypothetical protein
VDSGDEVRFGFHADAARRPNQPLEPTDRRYPELINDDTKLPENSFVVPDAALKDLPAALLGVVRRRGKPIEPPATPPVTRSRVGPSLV